MSKTVTIPSDRNPFVAEINGVKYEYKAGSTVTVPDEVAALIEDNKANDPKRGEYGAFYVWHSSVKGGGIGEKPERIPITDEILEKGYDLTKIVAADHIYGGYALGSGVQMTQVPDDSTAWIWTEMQTANGQTLKPVANETYYLKETQSGYLKTAQSFNSANPTKWTLVHSSVPASFDPSATEDTINEAIYSDAGIYVKGKTGATEVSEKISIRNSGGRWAAATKGKISGNSAASVFGAYGVKAGVIYAIQVGNTTGDKTFWVNDTVLCITPFAITKDGVEVCGTATRTIVLRDRSTNAETGYYTVQVNITAPFTPE